MLESLRQRPGVLAVLLLTDECVLLRSSVTPEESKKYLDPLRLVWERAKRSLSDITPEEDPLSFITLRTRSHEYMLSTGIALAHTNTAHMDMR